MDDPASSSGISKNGNHNSGLNFVQSEYSQTEVDLSGIIDPKDANTSKATWTSSAPSLLKDNQNLAWMFEVEEDVIDDYSKSLLEELDIDLKDIYCKVRCILLPFPSMGYHRNILENPDFWGPLFVVLMYALISLYGQFRVVSWIITIWFCGAFLIYVLTRALGGEVSYPFCLGIIGYSLIPLIAVAAVLPIVRGVYGVNLLIKVFGVLWASYSAGSLLLGDRLQHKRPLLLYPVFLLYVYFLSLYSGA